MKAVEERGMTSESQTTVTADAAGVQSAVEVSLPDSEPQGESRVVWAALLAAVLHWLSYFPVNWGWLGWVALVPLLVLVRSPARPRRVYFAAWLGGFAFFLPALHWFAYADAAVMMVLGTALAVYCALFWPLAIWLLRRLQFHTRIPLFLAVPVVWTALEYARAHLLTGFPWYFLGHSQHEFLPLIQISDLTGAYGVTFVLATANAVVFEWLCTRDSFARFFALPKCPCNRVIRCAAATALLVAATLAYGWLRLGQEDFAAGPRIALLQGNVEQRVRNEASNAAGEPDSPRGQMLRHYRDLIEQAVRQQPELLVWPETSFPDEWWDLAPGFDRAELAKLDGGVNVAGLPESNWQPAAVVALNREILPQLRRWPVDNLIGLSYRVMSNGDFKQGRRYNSAVLVRGSDELSDFPHYDKMHRVPFGEYLPLKDWLPFLAAFSPYDSDYSIHIGEHFTRFPLREYRYGVLICFEDTDPYLARQYVRSGADRERPVDFLVNISNDGWFNGSSEHDQHLAICRFRAVECRRSVARAVNMGISAVIDGSGRVIALPGEDWRHSKRVAAVVTSDIPIDRRRSPYAAFGDWLPVGCWFVVTVGLMCGMKRPANVVAG